MEASETAGAADLVVEFCGELYRPDADGVFGIGREGDLEIDENPYLHRRFLEISRSEGIWWLTNVGSLISATVADVSGGLQAWVVPGARIPLVFDHTNVIFTAGATTYEFAVHVRTPSFVRRQNPDEADVSGETTIGPIVFTDSQKALIVALAEPMLRRDGTGLSAIPTSAAAARRLGWPLTKFNRKLDNVCDRLDRVGVAGLRGGSGRLATNRRARLVEHAVSSHLVTADDLELLEREARASARAGSGPRGAGDDDGAEPEEGSAHAG
ncbi:hypothetical protein SPF06_08170 [Sinomonas sp. JGH33]|uniref:Uncharacterized protein n=1 Tax=Sinomonas terricola TaxID=3110330 RepID=A0ABU5T4V2_9MICC|nr:hypothetical protein [Sinomonas sp. JGH33]MEA5454693.1 hypothetical protein [Sinomonas sp. JGH33]